MKRENLIRLKKGLFETGGREFGVYDIRALVPDTEGIVSIATHVRRGN